MASPLRLKLEREEVPLARSAVLAVWRIEATLVMRRLAYGLALAIPVAVRHESRTGRTSRPVVDLVLTLRFITVAAFIVLVWSQIARDGRSQDDKRI